MVRPMLPFALGASLFLWATPTTRAAPQTVGGGGFILQFDQAWGSQYGYTVALDFDDSGLVDLAVQEDGGVAVHFEPGEWATHVEVGNLVHPFTTVNSFDGLMPFASAARASLILAVPSGTWHVYWDDEGVTSLDQRQWKEQQLVTGDTDWADVDIVRAGNIDGTDGPDIVGIKGNTIRFLLEDGSGDWATDSTNYPDIALGSGTVVDLELYDATGSGARNHLAVMFENRLEIWEADGTSAVATQTLNSSFESTDVTRIVHPDEEWIAWLVTSIDEETEDLDQPQYLGLVDRGFSTPISLVDEHSERMCLRGMCGGDYDADGYDDLVLQGPLHATDYLLINQRTTSGPPLLNFSYGYTKFETMGHSLDPEDVPSPYTAKPQIIDLDRDGDLDIIQPVEEAPGVFDAKVAGWRSAEIDQNAYKVVAAVDANEDPLLIDMCDDGTDTTLDVTVTVPETLPERATHVLLRCFVKTGQTTATDPEDMYWERLPLTAARNYTFSILLEGMTPPFNDQVVMWAVRLVEVDEGEMIDFYPVNNFLFAHTSTTTWPNDFLDDYLIAGDADILVDECDPFSTGPGGPAGGLRGTQGRPAAIPGWLGGPGGSNNGGGSTECLPGEDPPDPNPPGGGG